MYLFKTFLIIFFAVCYLWFAYGPDVQQESLGLSCHVTWSLPCHESVHSIAWGNNISAVTFVLLRARKRGICAQQMGQSHREALGDSSRCRQSGRSQLLTPMLRMWDLTNIPGHHKGTSEQAKTLLESISCVANNFGVPKMLHYVLRSEASAFPALRTQPYPYPLESRLSGSGNWRLRKWIRRRE